MITSIALQNARSFHGSCLRAAKVNFDSKTESSNWSGLLERSLKSTDVSVCMSWTGEIHHENPLVTQ